MNNNNRHSPLHLPRRALTFAVAVALFSSQSHAAPSGAEVVGGSATFRQSSTTHLIHQETDRVAINWQSFNIDAGEKVQFVQPSSQSLALNRVIGNDASQIMGRLDANGHVILVNPHGIIFSRAARVNVNGLVASGLDINPQDFINGGLAFKLTEGTDGVVINRGLIKAASGGNLALLGKRVINENLISAELGTVTLAAVVSDSCGGVGRLVSSRGRHGSGHRAHRVGGRAVARIRVELTARPRAVPHSALNCRPGLAVRAGPDSRLQGTTNAEVVSRSGRALAACSS